LAILLAWAAAIVIDAVRKESMSTAQLGALQNQVEVYGSDLNNLSTKFGSSTLASKSEIDEYFSASSKTMEELKEITSKLSADLKSNSTGSAQSEPLLETPADNLGGYSLTKFELQSPSERCFDNKSYQDRCDDVVEFPNGSSYSGFWENGQPDGNGKLTFTDGSYLDGIWQEGALVKIEQEEKVEQMVLKSVTNFHIVPAKDINSRFLEIVVGYQFDTGADKTWKKAYCYLSVKTDNGDLTINLSQFESFEGQKINSKYSYTSLFSESDFETSQKRCAYKWVGFN
jgi:hypothetical protein